MRSTLTWSSFIVLTVACGDDGSDKPDTTADTTADTAMDTAADTAADTATDVAPDTTADTSGDAVVERGRYLVEHVGVCGYCHSPRASDGTFDRTRWLAGIDCFIDAQPFFATLGCAATPNLTHHATGLMNRSDEQIKDMFLSGRRPDGTFLHPMMPYWLFGNMSTGDADAIVAYLRTVPGVDHEVAASQPPYSETQAAVPVADLSKVTMPREDYPDREAALRGRYLAANVGSCLYCHTKATAQGPEPRDLAKAFQGGDGFQREIFGLPPSVPAMVYPSNLTPHQSGLAGWTVADIERVLKEGISKDGTIVCPPMPSGPMGAFGGLSDADAEDIAHFLASLPPVDNVLPQGCGLAPMR